MRIYHTQRLLRKGNFQANNKLKNKQARNMR